MTYCKAIVFIIAIFPPSGIFSLISFEKKMSFIETVAPTTNFDNFSIFVIVSVAELVEKLNSTRMSKALATLLTLKRLSISLITVSRGGGASDIPLRENSGNQLLLFPPRP